MSEPARKSHRAPAPGSTGSARRHPQRMHFTYQPSVSNILSLPHATHVTYHRRGILYSFFHSKPSKSGGCFTQHISTPISHFKCPVATWPVAVVLTAQVHNELESQRMYRKCTGVTGHRGTCSTTPRGSIWQNWEYGRHSKQT